MLILHGQLGTICMVLGRAMAQQPSISARLYIGQCLTLANELTTHWGPGEHAVQNPGTDL